ncbi:uncharacterized protein THITE_2118191 [Thermothielavioides terrestris NRRL 8126]|uniref:Peptidase A1 domain-containing protein n=1 Tax=Thermothielavioides terrestris (strain ATCC 38088 / NRRL 8126) TaxID=578455 RepID=G2R919_THETT|nr:uncharacterized protein THITE_2118191 [Thermothielavioides terrestris NRRL 8126]AEO68614.1 hypothetical protein THITE_2118191 [Thermothielavioides terrestris NRRL 8126]
MAPHGRLRMRAALTSTLFAATAAAQHVLLPFVRHGGVAAAPGLSPRAASEQVGLVSSEYAFLADVSVGTPPQNLSLVISPSAGDTWVPDANTVECSPEWYYARYSHATDVPASRCNWGSFNKTRSSTYLPANRRYSTFGAESLDGASADGSNFTDTLVVAGIELDDYPMGLVDSATRWLGVLGLGRNLSSGYSSYSGDEAGQYANFMDRLVSSGKIATPAYSIWLDDAQGTSGGLLFGAVDQARFDGDLVRLPADESYQFYESSVAAFGATVTALNGTSGSGVAMPPVRTNDFPIDVVIGPAEILSYLPNTVADAVASMAGATFNETMDLYTIPCDAGKTSPAQFVLELGGSGGPQLRFETADLVVPTAAFYSVAYSLGNASNLCLFGIQQLSSGDSSSSSYISSPALYNLGSSLLRRTYAVFDLVNLEIAVAPVRFPSGSGAPSPTVVAFESYGATAPSATVFCASTYCQSATNSGSGSGSGSGSSSGSRSGSNSTSDALEHWQQVAIGLGVSLGVLFLIAAVAGVVICVRLLRARTSAAQAGDPEGAPDSGTPAAGTAESSAVAAQARNGPGTPVAPPRGALPVIQEKQEDGAAANRQAPIEAPQLPAASDRGSAIMSELSDAQQGQAEGQAEGQAQAEVEATGPEPAPASEPEAAPAAPGSPKGKGKEVDRSVGTAAQAQEDEAITMQAMHITGINRGVEDVVLWERGSPGAQS